MAIETLLNELDVSFASEEGLIRTIAETAKTSLNADQRYSAFIATSSTLPRDGVPISPDQLTINYPNEDEPLSYFGLGQAPYEDKFSKARGTGFRYQHGDGSIGYFIQYDLEATVVDQADVDYVLATFNKTVAINDILHFMKVIDYEGTQFDRDWFIVEEDASLV